MVTVEEQAYAGVPGNFLIQSDMVLPYLAKYGTNEQQEKYIKPMVNGETIGAIAMTEPHAGSNLQAMKTWAKGTIHNSLMPLVTGQLSTRSFKI